MDGPRSFIEHLNQHFYHPRSDAHSNAICMAILGDLVAQCDPLARRAREGELVAQLNHTVVVNHQRWNIDLALGPPADRAVAPPDGQPIRFAPPSLIEVAMEAKGVMTEHGKARHNRLRDLQAFHNHAHVYNRKVVAVGIVVVNLADVYWSPTRSEDDVTHHSNMGRLGKETIDLFRNLPLRNADSDGPGLEAACVLAITHDNLGKNPSPPAGTPAARTSELVDGPPAPQTGDPLHYATMIRRICRAYTERWL